MSRDEFEYAHDRQEEADCAEIARLARVRAAAEMSSRCEDCGYLRSALGHQVTCGPGHA